MSRSKLVIVSYAINGRGLGHLTRQLAILRWVRRHCAVLGLKAEIWVLTSSEADTLARREGFPALKLPSKVMMRDAGIDPARYLAIARSWVLNAIVGLQPDLLVVDTFPAGSFGELIAALELVKRRVLVARPVRREVERESAYAALLPLYQQILVPEAGRSTEERTFVGPIVAREREELLSRAEARAALGVTGAKRTVYVTMGGGGDPAASGVLPRLIADLVRTDWHVVVGAGPLYQGPELRGEGITWLDRYTPVELFSGFDAAVSAGGYNAYNELMFAGVPTVFLPQPRAADDQDERVSQAVTAGAGRLAKTMEEVPGLLNDVGTAAAARNLVPENGARKAALALLSGLVPVEDLRRAEQMFSPEVLGLSRSVDSNLVLDLLRAVGGETPSAWAERRAAGFELQDRGVTVGEIPREPPKGGNAASVLRLAEKLSIPLDLAIQWVSALGRKFPAASGSELVAACEIGFPVLARFDDWRGAVALLRAIPAQRTLTAPGFVELLGAWLSKENDLFDAQRSFVHLESGGQRTVAETLRLLSQGAASERGLLDGP